MCLIDKYNERQMHYTQMTHLFRTVCRRIQVDIYSLCIRGMTRHFDIHPYKALRNNKQRIYTYLIVSLIYTPLSLILAFKTG